MGIYRVAEKGYQCDGEEEETQRRDICASSDVWARLMVFTVEQATVYRAGGRRWFTQKAAIKAYAAAKFRAKHPCECEQGDYGSGYPGFTCHVHDVRERVLPRYIRILRRGIEAARAGGAVDPHVADPGKLSTRVKGI